MSELNLSDVNEFAERASGSAWSGEVLEGHLQAGQPLTEEEPGTGEGAPRIEPDMDPDGDGSPLREPGHGTDEEPEEEPRRREPEPEEEDEPQPEITPEIEPEPLPNEEAGLAGVKAAGEEPGVGGAAQQAGAGGGLESTGNLSREPEDETTDEAHSGPAALKGLGVAPAPLPKTGDGMEDHGVAGLEETRPGAAESNETGSGGAGSGVKHEAEGGGGLEEAEPAAGGLLASPAAERDPGLPAVSQRVEGGSDASVLATGTASVKLPETGAGAQGSPSHVVSPIKDVPAAGGTLPGSPKAAVGVTPRPVAAKVEEPAEPEESFADLYSQFQKTSSRREPGASQIRGTVVSVTADSVLVDIGYKSEGILPLTAFREAPKSGDTALVSVKGRGEDGYYELSLFKTAVPRDWSGLERAFEQKATIPATVTAVVKGGLHVDVGVKAFLPASRSGARDAAEMEKLVGEEIRVRITKLDVADEDVVVDRRVVTEEEAVETRAKRYAEVEEGAVVDGTVRSITDYGAFVDVGGVDGLLHISDISWSRVTNVADVLTVGQRLEVKVLKVDAETKKIGLGLKQLQPHPWDGIEQRLKAGDRVRGVVTRITDFGAFVEIEPGIEGLVHISEMSWSKRIHKVTEVVKVGDVVEAMILNINTAEKRVSLGLKQALGDPWVEAGAKLTPGSVVEGTVSSLTKFGAFVQVSEGVEGMVHISEIVADRRLNHPSDALRVGEKVKAMVLELDKEKRQLKLSIKQLIPTSVDEFVAEHAVGDKVSGRVVSVADGVATVELGEGIVCPCTLPVIAEKKAEAAEAVSSGKVDLSAFTSMLKTKWKTGSDAAKATDGVEAVKVGQVREFRISQLDKEAKRIGLELLG